MYLGIDISSNGDEINNNVLKFPTKELAIEHLYIKYTDLFAYIVNGKKIIGKDANDNSPLSKEDFSTLLSEYGCTEITSMETGWDYSYKFQVLNDDDFS